MATTESDTSAAFDHRVRLHEVSWSDYQRLLAMRGEKAVPRITYVDGEVELMGPSRRHEWISRTIGRLVEVYSEERELDLNCLGSWTVKKRRSKRGLEPDVCYIVGPEEKRRPDLAIEVVLTSGGLDKLDVYRGLGVPEVWFWIQGRITVHLLRGEEYEEADRSALLPGLDLAQLAVLVEHPSQTQAAREYRSALRRDQATDR